MTELYKTYYTSKIGVIELTATGRAIRSLVFMPEDTAPEVSDPAIPDILRAGLEQLDEYFRGRRRQFDLALEPEGTSFQKSVWDQLLLVGYGETVSYLDIALILKNRNAVRAVGGANSQNPISIIIPCHRVIGSDGSLTGYGGGLWRKAWLLKHEGWVPNPQLRLF
jgi:methylated-DNA-[protein]-cysteine S-methyltransferase